MKTLMGDAAAHPLREHGFWDYTTPGTGGMEGYELHDYLLLLDDMQAAGMNSLVIVVKWFTTGYKSRLPFLDQQPDNPVIASGNRLLRQVIEEASRRKIKIWLGAVVTFFPAEPRGDFSGPPLSYKIETYDPDMPEAQDRAVRIMAEIVELFPGIGGLMVEMECAGKALPHRIPLYNQWAASHGRTPFDRLCENLDGRSFDLPDWRDYTTERRIALLKAIESTVRDKGFVGDLVTIAETGRTPYTYAHELNLAMFRNACPAWSVLTYEYDKGEQRFASMDYAVSVPRQHGLEVAYLPRGVMTWSGVWPRPMSLAEGWRMDVEDIKMFRPDRVWWFGSGGETSGGFHVCKDRLRSGQDRFASGRDARRALLRAAAPLGLAVPPR